MDDPQRYRMNAAECLSAAERCAPPFRGLTLAIAASWRAMDELLAIWSQASSDTLADTSRRRFQYPRDLHRLPFKMPARRWDAPLQERESISLTS
jgi:hypothetical protein